MASNIETQIKQINALVKSKTAEDLLKLTSVIAALSRTLAEFKVKTIDLKFTANISAVEKALKKIAAMRVPAGKRDKYGKITVPSTVREIAGIKRGAAEAGTLVEEIKGLQEIEKLKEKIAALEKRASELKARNLQKTKDDLDVYKKKLKTIEIENKKTKAFQSFRNKITKAQISSENKLGELGRQISLNKVKDAAQDVKLLKNAYRKRDVLNNIALTEKNSARIKALSVKNTKIINRLQANIATKITAGAKAQEKARKAAVGLGAALKTSFNEAFSLEKITNRIAFVMTAKLAYDMFDRINRAIKAIVVNAVKFEASMSTIYTLLDDSQKVLKKMLSKEVLGAMTKYGEDMETATRAMYDILSARIPPEWAGFVLETAMKGAIAGFTDVKVAGDAVTTMINSFNLSASRAVDVSDLLFQIIKYGKCLTGDTRVLLSDGSYTRIDKLKDNVEIISWDYKNFIPMSAKFVDMGTKETIKLTTQDGRIIKTTPEHPYLTSDGWKRVDEISVGDKIAVPNSLPFFGNIKPQEGLAELLGYLLAEGSIYSATPRLAIANPIILQEVKKAANAFGINIKKSNQKDKSKCASYSLPFSKRGGVSKKNPLTEILKKYKLHGCTCYNKFIPEEIFRWKKDYIAKLLKAYFNGDGAFYKTGSFHLDFTSVSEQLVRDISHLLLRFGITGKIRKKKTAWTYKNIRKKSFAWEWSTSRYVNIRRYLDFIGIDKSNKTVFCFENYQPNRDNNAKHLNSFGKTKLQLTRYKRYRGCISPETQIDYVKVKSIVSSKMEKVYDLVVPILHNFVASDVICHNTVLEELGPDLGKVTASANLLGISMEEVGAMLATMTQTGLKTNVAITSLRQLMITLASPTDKAKKIFEKYSLQLDLATVRQRGLAYAVQQLNGLTEEEIVTIAKSRRGFMALAVAMGRNNVYLDNYNHMLNRAGASQAAFEERAQTLEFQFKKLKQSMIAMGLGLQGFVTTIGKPLLTMLSNVFTALSKWWVILPIITGLVVMFRVKLISLIKAIALSISHIEKAALVTSGIIAAIVIAITVTGALIRAHKKAKEEREALNKEILASIQHEREEKETLRELLDEYKNLSIDEIKNAEAKEKIVEVLNTLNPSNEEYEKKIAELTERIEALTKAEKYYAESKALDMIIQYEKNIVKYGKEIWNVFEKKLLIPKVLQKWRKAFKDLVGSEEYLTFKFDFKKGVSKEVIEGFNETLVILKEESSKLYDEIIVMEEGSDRKRLENKKNHYDELISAYTKYLDEAKAYTKLIVETGAGEWSPLTSPYLKKQYKESKKEFEKQLKLYAENGDNLEKVLEAQRKVIRYSIATNRTMVIEETITDKDIVRAKEAYILKRKNLGIKLKAEYDLEAEKNKVFGKSNEVALQSYIAFVAEEIATLKTQVDEQPKLWAKLAKAQILYNKLMGIKAPKTQLEIQKEELELTKAKYGATQAGLKGYKTGIEDVRKAHILYINELEKQENLFALIYDKTKTQELISAKMALASFNKGILQDEIKAEKLIDALRLQAYGNTVDRIKEEYKQKVKLSKDIVFTEEQRIKYLALLESAYTDKIIKAKLDKYTKDLNTYIKYNDLKKEELEEYLLLELAAAKLAGDAWKVAYIENLIDAGVAKKKIDWKTILGIPKDAISFIQGQLQSIYKSAEDWILNYHLQRLEKSYQHDLTYLGKQRELESGTINKTILTQAHKAKALEALNKKHEKKKADLEKKYAKKKAEAERDKAIFSIVIETAKGLVAAFPNVLQMAILSALSAAQIAIVSAAKYAKGGFTGQGKERDETGKRVAGIVHEKEFVFKEQATEGNVAMLYAMQKELSKGRSFNEFALNYLRNEVKGFIPRPINQPRLTYAGGGYAGNNTTITNDYSGLENKMDKIIDVFNEIEYISLEPIDDRVIYKMNKRGKRMSGEF